MTRTGRGAAVRGPAAPLAHKLPRTQTEGFIPVVRTIFTE